MMRSLYSGVSGLKTHQTKMDVIGNNIANVNTVAYKSQSVTFQDVMYQTTQSASGPNAATGVGGKNAKQIGLGVTTGAITANITTAGATQTTNNPFDVKITGDSFFIVNNGTQNFYTKAGNFTVDSAGNLVQSTNGYNVMGWQVDDEGVIQKAAVSPLQIMSAKNQTSDAQATTKATVAGIINKDDENINSEAGKIINLTFTDALGYSYNANFSIHSTSGLTVAGTTPDASGGTDNSPADALAALNTQLGLAGNNALVEGTTKLPNGNNQVVSIKDNGDGTYTAERRETYGDGYFYIKLDKILDANNRDVIADSGAAFGGTLGFTDANGDPINSAILVKFDPDKGGLTAIDGDADAKTSTLTFGNNAGQNRFEDIEIDFSGTQMKGSASSVAIKPGEADGSTGKGRKVGKMINISIQPNGMIYGTYDNGDQKCLGQIAVTQFSNPSGLQKEGDNLYSETLNSGEFDGIGVDITVDNGSMATGVLEMSNVDLSSEFTEMITTQRGFQANSRIITVSDTLIEELVNLKR